VRSAGAKRGGQDGDRCMARGVTLSWTPMVRRHMVGEGMVVGRVCVGDLEDCTVGAVALSSSLLFE
jgi:hypothetical protein